MAEKVTIGVLAAMEREIAPLTEAWEAAASLGGCRVLRRRDAVLLCSGIGLERAAGNTKALLGSFQPEMLLSVGFAGALRRGMEVGQILVPARVVRAADGATYGTVFGDGVLVSDDRVGGAARKRELSLTYDADAVNMEAAGVAAAAAARGVRFAAVKVVSDGLDDELDFLAPFVRPEGFQSGRFLAHVAVRPKLWAAVRRLKRNSERASAALCGAIEEFLCEPERFAERHRDSSREAIIQK